MEEAIVRTGLPELLSTQQAARFLEGISVTSSRQMDTTKFCRFADRFGIRPRLERFTTRGRGKNAVSYAIRYWSRRQIERALENGVK